MNKRIIAKFVASLLIFNSSAAYSEPVYLFRMPSGMAKVGEAAGSDTISLNFSSAAFYVADNVSLNGLVKSGDSISLESGTLPPGLSLQGSSITGTPTTAGTYSGIHFKVTNSKGEGKVFGPYSIKIVGSVQASFAPLQITTNTAYSQTLAVSGGMAPLSFRVVGGSLPSGLTLSAGGVLSGNIATPTDADLTIEVTDGKGRSSTGSLFVSVVNRLNVSYTYDTSYAGELQTWRIVTSGGYGDLSYKFIGSVPGMALGANGNITGTPSQSGKFSYEVEATDSALFPQTGKLTIHHEVYDLPKVYYSQVEGMVGEPMESIFPGFDYVVQEGVRPYFFELTSSDGKALPDGLTLESSSGKITGIPAELFLKTVQLTITDAGGKKASGNVRVEITGPLEVKMPDTITYYIGEEITSYDYPPEITGGTSSYFMYDIEVEGGGQLPDGLSFDSLNGTIVGTPTTEASFKYRIVVTDLMSYRTYYSNEVFATVEHKAAPAFVVKIPPSMTLKVGTPVNGRVIDIQPNTWYSYQLEVDGVLGGSLLPGLSNNLFDNFPQYTDLFGGTPTQAGVFRIRLLATDLYNSRESHFSNEMIVTVEP